MIRYEFLTLQNSTALSGRMVCSACKHHGTIIPNQQVYISDWNFWLHLLGRSLSQSHCLNHELLQFLVVSSSQ